ncbi:hypothetical protein [Microbispora triticiradicis]|uniref:hypothetical protein n=1 Tax=Microbispora triticiradicis TaxID=2200763 RepID=UPI001AD835DE|nr:hypothetical protein [Microbispora triticiradicis]
MLELLAKAPDPAAAARLTIGQITTVLKRARRRGDLAERASRIKAALRTEHLGQPAEVTAAYAVDGLCSRSPCTRSPLKCTPKSIKLRGMPSLNADLRAEPGAGCLCRSRAVSVVVSAVRQWRSS